MTLSPLALIGLWAPWLALALPLSGSPPLEFLELLAALHSVSQLAPSPSDSSEAVLQRSSQTSCHSDLMLPTTQSSKGALGTVPSWVYSNVPWDQHLCTECGGDWYQDLLGISKSMGVHHVLYIKMAYCLHINYVHPPWYLSHFWLLTTNI